MNEFTDDDWLTPPELLESLGAFDLDPCAPLNRPWDMAAKHFTIEDNGLRQAWALAGRASTRVWLNPPYSKTPDATPRVLLWLNKMIAHRDAGGSGIALTNASPETEWFSKCVWQSATAIVFPKTRIKFYRPDGTCPGAGKKPNVIIAYTDADAAILYHAQATTRFSPLREGKFIPLVIKITADFRTTWRRLIRWLLKECGGTATLEQIYAMAIGHPKTLSNPNWKAKIRQQVQREATRIGPALWQQHFEQPTLV